MIKKLSGILIIICLGLAVTQAPTLAEYFIDIYNEMNEITLKGLYDTQTEASQPY